MPPLAAAVAADVTARRVGGSPPALVDEPDESLRDATTGGLDAAPPPP